ncbi:unnamed protein product [Absidia cylindrospora]
MPQQIQSIDETHNILNSHQPTTPTSSQPSSQSTPSQNSRGVWTPARELEFMKAIAEMEPYKLPRGQIRPKWDELVIRVNLIDRTRPDGSVRHGISYNSVMNKKKEIFSRYKDRFTQSFINSNSGINHFHDDLEEAAYDAYTKFDAWESQSITVRNANRQHGVDRDRHNRNMRQAALGGVGTIANAQEQDLDQDASIGGSEGDNGIQQQQSPQPQPRPQQQQQRRRRRRPHDEDEGEARRTRHRESDDIMERALELVAEDTTQRELDRDMARKTLSVMENLLRLLSQQQPPQFDN